MTAERYLILAFAIAGAVGTAASGASPILGLPPVVPFIGSLVAIGSTTALALLRGWFDAAPPPAPHG